jgi:hypothetical protein
MSQMSSCGLQGLPLIAYCLALAVVTVLTSPQASGAEPKFDVNDVSYLWPVPSTTEDVDRLISADLAVADGGTLWPEKAFETVLNSALSVSISAPSGRTARIIFGGFEGEFKKLATWKVVAFRVDGSAPGSHSPLVQLFGSTPQIRVIVQPVTVRSGTVRVHDFTAHLVFDFVKGHLPPANAAGPRRADPDDETFKALLDDLKRLKETAGEAEHQTNGKLSIHPGLKNDVAGFRDRVSSMLKNHLRDSRLRAVSFMGLDSSEPWLFFAMSRPTSNDNLTLFAPPSFKPATAQMLSFRDGPPVTPMPNNRNFEEHGVSTATLFERSALQRLEERLFEGETSPRLKDIPDLIANPQRAHFFNTDCVSCHSESARRAALNLTIEDSPFRFQIPEGVSGPDESLLPRDQWNVRNLGWFPRGNKAVATVTMRTANEAAESVHFINERYFGTAPRRRESEESPTGPPSSAIDGQPHRAVSNALTLVVTAKSDEDLQKLKALIKQLQGLPREQNPIVQAMDRLGTVHFARFVFLKDRQLAIITSYDGEFDRYIDAFINEIGEVFDKILLHVEDASPVPVSRHRDEFLEFVRKHDLQSEPPFYSAYPKLTVGEIRAMERKTSGQTQ